MHNTENVLAHPGRYLHCKQFCSEASISEWWKNKLWLTFVILNLPLRRWKRWRKLSSKSHPSLVSLLWNCDNCCSIASLVILCEVSSNQKEMGGKTGRSNWATKWGRRGETETGSGVGYSSRTSVHRRFCRAQSRLKCLSKGTCGRVLL